MNRIQFWILSGSCLIVGLLYLAQIPLNLGIRSASHELVGMNLLIEQGPQYHDLWQKVAYRAYQLGQQDPGLADVLRREQITITPRAAAPAPAAASAPASPTRRPLP